MQKFTELHKDVHSKLNEEQKDLDRKKFLLLLENRMKEQDVTNLQNLEKQQLLNFINNLE